MAYVDLTHVVDDYGAAEAMVAFENVLKKLDERRKIDEKGERKGSTSLSALALD